MSPRSLLPRAPLSYLITSGETNSATAASSEEFARVLAVVRAGVAAGVSLIQLREKELTARALFDLTRQAAEAARGSATRLLVNDRADIARAAGAAGVHLTARSLPARAARQTFGEQFLIGVSTHTLAEAQAARAGGADFALFGPVFDTPAKREYGSPLGLAALRAAANALAPFPLIAVGGINLENAREALAAGAQGVAAIRLFHDPGRLVEIVRALDSLP